MASTVHHQVHPATAYPEYKYERIDLATDAIRLLRILRGPYDSPVRCHIFQSHLDRDIGVPYKALSYAWGEPSAERLAINIVDEASGATSSLHVYPNLHEILRHLRQSNKDQIFWIDAVCIDQSHNRERTHQVGQMRLVYKNAEKVVIWLGDFDIDVQMLMKFAQKLDVRALEDPIHASSVTNAWELRFQEEMANNGFKGDDNSQYQRVLSAMSHLLERPWFGRTWIIQEVASARTVMVMCPGLDGRTTSVSTRTFTILPSLMGLVPNPHVQSILDVMPVKGQLRRGWWNEQRDLKTLLVKFQGSECSDPRDSVYALLGVCSDTGVKTIINADYSIPTELLFKKTLSYLLFSEVVDEQTCRLPGDRATFFEALNHPAGVPQWALEWACKNGSGTTVQRLLDLRETKCDALRSEWSQLAVEDCSDRGRKRRAVSNEVVDVNACIDGSESTLLHTAVKNGHEAVIRALLTRRDLNINSLAYGDTLPHLAIRAGQTSFAKILLAHNDTDVNLPSPEFTPLHTAVQNGHEAVIRALLTRRDLNINSLAYGDTPLHLAIRAGQTSIAKILLAHNDCDVSLPDSDGTRPLLRAMMDRRVDPGLAKVIRRHKNIDAKLAWALSPLSLAVLTGDEDKFDQIFKPKSSRGRNLHDSVINQALHYALKIYFSDVNNSRGRNPYESITDEVLHYAFKTGWASKNILRGLKFVSTIWGNKFESVDLNWKDGSGDTLLGILVKADIMPQDVGGSFGLSETLTNGQINLNITTRCDGHHGISEMTPLKIAAIYGHDRMVGHLLRTGNPRRHKTKDPDPSRKFRLIGGLFRPKTKDPDPRRVVDLETGLGECYGTPLWAAVSRGHIVVTTILLENGADRESKGWHASESDPNPTMVGVTPLWQAVHLGNVQVVRLLISHGADLRTTGRALHQTATGPALEEEERTLMEEARFHGFNDIVDLLSNHE